jgi:hypothetical protein
MLAVTVSLRSVLLSMEQFISNGRFKLIETCKFQPPSYSLALRIYANGSV